jgi:hypothetical protein
MLKRFEDWTGDLHEFLQVGDEVDQEIADYILEVLPPAYHTRTVYQMGSAMNTVNGKATFITVAKTDEKWFYAGLCHLGDTKEPLPPFKNGDMVRGHNMKATNNWQDTTQAERCSWRSGLITQRGYHEQTTIQRSPDDRSESLSSASEGYCCCE